MKKALALLVCMIFVLSTTSFALWGWGKKSTGEAKTKIMMKAEKKAKKAEVKKVIVKKKVITKKAIKKEEKKPAPKK